jgi:hypothetical protein
MALFTMIVFEDFGLVPKEVLIGEGSSHCQYQRNGFYSNH